MAKKQKTDIRSFEDIKGKATFKPKHLNSIYWKKIIKGILENVLEHLHSFCEPYSDNNSFHSLENMLSEVEDNINTNSKDDIHSSIYKVITAADDNMACISFYDTENDDESQYIEEGLSYICKKYAYN